MVETSGTRLVTAEQAKIGDLMLRLHDGVDDTIGIISFLYHHKEFRRIAYWLIRHGFVGIKLVEYFEEGHELSVLNLLKEIKRYELGLNGDVFDYEFNDDREDSLTYRRD